MARKKTGWRAPFLRALRGSGNVRVAAREAGVDPGTAYDWRVKDAGFARRWEEAKAKAAARVPLHRRSGGPSPRGKLGEELVLRRTKRGEQMVRAAAGRWSAKVEAAFLEGLRETACVRSAAAAAGISTTALYNRREKYPEFAERWDAVEAAARSRVPGLLVAATLASLDGEGAKRPGRLPKVSVDQAIRISKMEADRDRTGGGLRGRGIRPRMATNAEVREALTKALTAFGAREVQSRAQKLASGWTELGDGTMIPPGWVYVGTQGGV